MRYLLFALIATAFAACDEIGENERYIEKEAVEVKRNVLIEDFTGQSCSNCPKAHEIADALMQQYVGNVITVGIHAGPFAYEEGTKSYPTFKTTDGDVYAEAAGVTVYPSGVINRSSGVLDPSDWASCVANELQKDTQLAIELTPVFNADSTEIEIQTVCKSAVDIEGKLQIWITESGIISRQKNGSTWIKEYEHNHVYRAAVNGVEGERVSLVQNVFADYNHKCAVRTDWNASNLAVVAFVYDNDGVVQVVENKVR